MLLGPTESWSMEGAPGSSWSHGRTWLLPETRVLNLERAGKEFIWRCTEGEASRTSKEILGEVIKGIKLELRDKSMLAVETTKSRSRS